MTEYVVVILCIAALAYYFLTKRGKGNSDDSALDGPVDHSRYAFGREYPESWNALAFKLMSRKAHAGNADAQIALGYLYANGLGVSTDVATAIKWYELAAENQHSVALFRLAGHYVDGAGVAKDESKGVNYCLQAAMLGNVEAQNTIGNVYSIGAFGTKQDLEESLYWYIKAAEQNYVPAQIALGNRFAETGVTQDFAKSDYWLRKAAGMGNAEAQYRIGFNYSVGTPIQAVEHAIAFSWFLLAAKQGHTIAQYNVGYAYLTGEGVEKDALEAEAWLKLAAEGGNDMAQFCLGTMYDKGIGIAPDQAEAFKWFSLSANQGNEAAQSRIAEI